MIAEIPIGYPLLTEAAISLVLRLFLSLEWLFLLNWHYQIISRVKYGGSLKKLRLFILVWFLEASEGLIFYLFPLGIDIALGLSEGYFNPQTLLILDILKIVFYLLAEIFHFIYSLRYFLCPFIIAAEEGLSVWKTVSLSVRIMRGRKTETAVFLFSTARYLLYSLAIIPAFHFLPKFFSSIVVWGKYILTKSRIEEGKCSYN